MQNNTLFTLPRSDLACERTTPSVDEKTSAIKEYILNGFHVDEVIISGDSHFRDGSYTTVDIGELWLCSDSAVGRCKDTLTTILRNYVNTASNRKPTNELCILVAGLGNRFITADSLGPLTADKITVTNHAMDKGIFTSLGCSRICAIVPGVLGQTGIETAEIIKNTATAVHPDIVIAIDSLAARSVKKLASIVQISDTGISPGSGTGDKHTPINRESIGCPVISVGVPTVVDSATLVFDALRESGISDMPKQLSQTLHNERRYFVSPKDSDLIVDELSTVISSAICCTAGL